MLFINHKQLLRNAMNPALRDDALKILEYAINSVNPNEAMLRSISINKNILTIGEDEYRLDSYHRIIVLGGGKASGCMAEALESIIGDRISNGAIIVLEGTQSKYNLNHISTYGASHPIPNEKNVESTRIMLANLSNITDKDLVFVLISGGGSALMTLPADGIPLKDLQVVTNILLHSGATINELNTIRKHLSNLKGGLLTKKTYPATLISLILSDVIGDPLDVIASGPTIADSTTYQDAIAVLSKYNLIDKTPETIKNRFEQGISGRVSETTKPGGPELRNVNNYVIGNVKLACEAAKRKAESLGYNSQVIRTDLQGESRKQGVELATLVLDQLFDEKLPKALIFGGETTVHVTGNGIGGRNHELVLSTVELLSGSGIVLTSIATDGVDGASASAGAIVDGKTLTRAKRMGMEPSEYLENNDSYTFFNALGDTLNTGHTKTNVNDLTLILIPDE